MQSDKADMGWLMSAGIAKAKYDGMECMSGIISLAGGAQQVTSRPWSAATFAVSRTDTVRQRSRLRHVH